MSRSRSRWLVGATAASFAIALLHVAMIPVGAAAYRFFAAGDQMVRWAERGSPVPALATFVLALVFAGFGLYGAAALGHLHLPATRVVIIVIGCIYTLRGALIVPEALMVAHLGHPPRALVFSLASFLIGVAHLVGIYRQWPFIPRGIPGGAHPGETREV